ncbi:MAG: metal-sensitive transcriptional regulator [Candidatus Omnitrophota bacterium]
MKQVTAHNEQLVFLRKIEGQIRGIQRMIKENRYCVDILVQLNSIIGAVLRVEDKVFRKHLDGCVTQALKGRSQLEKQKKIEEIMSLIRKFRRGL